jgi:hypothetical protein
VRAGRLDEMEPLALTEDEKRTLVQRYANCRTRDEKRALAAEMNLELEKLYNLCSRLSCYLPGAEQG